MHAQEHLNSWRSRATFLTGVRLVNSQSKQVVDRLSLSGAPCSIHAIGDMIAIQTKTHLVAYARDRLLNARIEDPRRKIARLMANPAAEALVTGLPLAGPKSERWALNVVEDVAAKVLPPEVHAQWTKSQRGAKKTSLETLYRHRYRRHLEVARYEAFPRGCVSTQVS